jgi:hypothetical protein
MLRELYSIYLITISLNKNTTNSVLFFVSEVGRTARSIIYHDLARPGIAFLRHTD